MRENPGCVMGNPPPGSSDIPPRPGTRSASGEEREILRVAAELRADSPEAGASTCRAALLDWIASPSGGALPREAAANGVFSFADGERRCEGIRVSGAGLDVWAVRLRRPDPEDSARFWTTEACCEASAGAACVVRGRQLLEGVAPPDLEPRVPEFLGQLAARAPLEQFGEPVTPDPWLIDSEAAVAQLAEALTDTARRRPIVVLSVPDNATDPNQPLLDPQSLARDALGLARVVVLPPTHSWDLTKRIGDKRLAVFLGAVRIYLPGFRLDARGRDHLRIPRVRFESDDGAKRHRARILRQVAEYGLQTHPAWSFEAVRELARRPDGARGVSGGSKERSPVSPPTARRPPGAGTAAPPRGPRLAAAVETKPATRPAPRRPAKAAAPPERRAPRTASKKAAAPPERRAPRTASKKAAAPPERRGRHPAGPAAGKPAAPGERPAPAGWLRNPLRMLAALFSRAPGPGADDPERQRLEQENSALWSRLRQADAARERAIRQLRTTEREKDFYFSEYEKAHAADRQRSTAEREGHKRAQTLDAQLRRYGRIPHPDDWKDLTRWCQKELGEQLELRPAAVQGIKKAEFEDLGLTAECLVWLAHTYREYRRTSPGQALDIRNDVDSRLSDGPAARNINFRDWEHVPRHEHRNIGRGNSRERKNCLRIYYYWDAAAEKVVIVSMPHHAQTRT